MSDELEGQLQATLATAAALFRQLEVITAQAEVLSAQVARLQQLQRASVPQASPEDTLAKVFQKPRHFMEGSPDGEQEKEERPSRRHSRAPHGQGG